MFFLMFLLPGDVFFLFLFCFAFRYIKYAPYNHIISVIVPWEKLAFPAEINHLYFDSTHDLVFIKK